MSGQPELDFGLRDRIARGQSKVLRVLGDVVEELGIAVVSCACDCGRTELLDALAGRASRYFRTDWYVAIYTVASADQRRRMRDAAAPTERHRTPAEELRDLREYVAANAAGTLRAFDKDSGK